MPFSRVKLENIVSDKSARKRQAGIVPHNKNTNFLPVIFSVDDFVPKCVLRKYQGQEPSLNLNDSYKIKEARN